MTISKEVESLEDSFDEAWSKLLWRNEDGSTKPMSPSASRRRSTGRKSSPKKSTRTTISRSSSGSDNSSSLVGSADTLTKQGSSHKNSFSWRDDEHEKENIASSSWHLKSPGLAPDKFHRKSYSDPKEKAIAEELEKRIEVSLLKQQKLKHKDKLEAERRIFRKVTTLKMWPLQDMAMEHLDHLLDEKASLSQFHGGEYLSGESASSTGSAYQGGKRRQGPLGGSANDHCADAILDSGSPLWSQEPRIFATEKAHGKRKYLVGHFGRIADWYWRKCVNKHLYEVIRQDTPCRLYFDLEYSKKFNSGIDEKALLDDFREELIAEFKMTYNVHLTPNHIIDLDSSNKDKFSRHWILVLDDEGFFEDAPTAGMFVKQLTSRLAEEQGTNQLHSRRPTLAKHLFVNTKDANKPTCFIDLGVYTRNRLFRCYGSSKFGKPNALNEAGSNQHPLPLLPENVRGKDCDISSHNIEDNAAQTSSFGEYVTANNWEPHANILAATLVIPLGGSEGKRIFRMEGDGGQTNSCLLQGKRSDSTGRVYQAAVSIHSAKSPLPSLETYVIEELGCRGGSYGAIRAWSLEYGGPKGDIPVSITFQMCKNRYCELIGRSHKSNNIFWTIIFENWTCVQGCHDPDCFGRGAPVPICGEHAMQIREEYERWRDEEFEKALMNLNLQDLSTPATENSLENNIAATTTSFEPQKESQDSIMEKSPTKKDVEFLSDDALIEAIAANPELFP